MFARGIDVIDIRTNQVVHIQDTDAIEQIAKVGIPDTNGIIWDAKWVDYSFLKYIEKESTK